MVSYNYDVAGNLLKRQMSTAGGMIRSTSIPGTYHPGRGRFLQVDPNGFDAGDMNLFRYCGGDPANKRDPLGLYVSGLTSFGGGEWIVNADGITHREIDLIVGARLMDATVADEWFDDRSKTWHERIQECFRCGRFSGRQGDEFAKSGGRDGTEAWASFGVDTRTCMHAVLSVRCGSGEDPDFQDDYSGGVH
jgi:hypothetical protein